MRRGGAWVVPRRQGRKKKTCLWVIHFYHINAQKISILLNVVHHHRLYASFATGHAAMEINVPSLPGRPLLSKLRMRQDVAPLFMLIMHFKKNQ